MDTKGYYSVNQSLLLANTNDLTELAAILGPIKLINSDIAFLLKRNRGLRYKKTATLWGTQNCVLYLI